MSLRDPKVLKIVLTAAICGLALWGYFISDLLPFGYRRQTEKTRELTVAQENLAAELEKARRAVADLPQLEREQAELERKWKQAELLLPTDKEMAVLLTQITQAGEQAGVKFKLFKPGAQLPKEFYSENPVDIQVRGGYHQVGVMLARLANLSRIVSVDNLSLEATKQKGRKERDKDKKDGVDTDDRTDHTLIASFTATAYSLRDPSQVEQAPPAEKGAARPVRTAAGRAKPAAQAGVGGPSKATSAAITKRLSDKAKANANAPANAQSNEGGAQ